MIMKKLDQGLSILPLSFGIYLSKEKDLCVEVLQDLFSMVIVKLVPIMLDLETKYNIGCFNGSGMHQHHKI